MRFTHSDPDIETLVRRIERGLIDLQPDFQRGSVWSPGKKQRLIDSIIRGWHIPPVHLVRRGDAAWDVLDGQQRLSAIRDFKRNEFPIDGGIEPLTEQILKLDGVRWSGLPEEVRNRIDSFTIRIFELTDFTPKEPYELFFRLNQPTNLTEAEKRNAFIGEARNQVKALTAWAQDEGLRQELIGFGGARMAYDDTFSRFLLTLEEGTLLKKVTASRITERYRSEQPFADYDIQVAKWCIQRLISDLQDCNEGASTRVKLNKATFHTWLCVYAHAHKMGLLADLNTASVMGRLETSRALRSSSVGVGMTLEAMLFTIYDDRATSRVADVSSVVLRDLVAWLMLTHDDDSLSLRVKTLGHGVGLIAQQASDAAVAGEDGEALLLGYASAADWGGTEWL